VTNCCLGATAQKLNEKASLYEGHGFSRAVNRLCLTASAALQPLRFFATADIFFILGEDTANPAQVEL
jgi:hypothetical protein